MEEGDKGKITELLKKQTLSDLKKTVSELRRVRALANYSLEVICNHLFISKGYQKVIIPTE